MVVNLCRCRYNSSSSSSSFFLPKYTSISSITQEEEEEEKEEANIVFFPPFIYSRIQFNNMLNIILYNNVFKVIKKKYCY